MKKNYYNILEVSHQATHEQIRIAVVQLGRKYAAKALKNKEAHSKFTEIQQAYKVLSNPQRRKYHDEDLAEQQLAEQQLAEQRLAEQQLAKQQLAEQRLAKQQAKQQAKQARQQAKQNVDIPQEIKEEQPNESITTKQDKLRDLTKLSLNSEQIEAKKHCYNLFGDEIIVFYSKPHFLSCLDIAALILIFLSSYLYIADPLKEYMPTIILWMPSQLSTALPQISLWQLGIGTMLIMGIVVQLEVIMTKFSTELLLTQDRIIAETGILGRKKTEIKLNAMESITIRQSLLGRLFDYGSVVIIGMGQGKTVLRDIIAPHKMSRLIWFHLKAKKEE
jgi:uncharacterized membrane protein YdbT with pleckstrin-like domain